MKNTAQVSVELLLIAAAVVSLAIVLVTQLHSSVSGASKKLASKSNDLLDYIDKNITT